MWQRSRSSLPQHFLFWQCPLFGHAHWLVERLPSSLPPSPTTHPDRLAGSCAVGSKRRFLSVVLHDFICQCYHYNSVTTISQKLRPAVIFLFPLQFKRTNPFRLDIILTRAGMSFTHIFVHLTDATLCHFRRAKFSRKRRSFTLADFRRLPLRYFDLSFCR